LELSADDAVLVFINFHNGWISDTSEIDNAGQFEDFRKNADALNQVGQAFNLPTFMVSADN